MRDTEKIFVVFDGTPGPTGPHFVEVENEQGQGRRFEWLPYKDGLWRLGPFYGQPLAVSEQGASTPRTDACVREHDGLGAGDAYHAVITLARTLEAENARLREDAERLDYVQSVTKGYGRGWILRNSTNGRGMRLHETSKVGAHPTVRAAIDAALAALRESEAEREKAARECAAFVKETCRDRFYGAEEWEAAILRHFNLEAK